MPTYQIPEGATEFSIGLTDPVFTIPPPLPDPNEPPTVNAGSDVIITLPTNTVTLVGSAGDPDGAIVDYFWEQTSGATAIIDSRESRTTIVSGLSEGINTFQLNVTDNDGAHAFDYVNVTVKPAVVPPPSDDYTQLFNFTLNPNDPSTAIIKKMLNDHGQYGAGGLTTLNGIDVFRAQCKFDGSVSRSEIQFDENPYTPQEGAWEFDALYSSIPSNAGRNGLSSQFHGYASGTSGQGSMWFASANSWLIQEQVDNHNNTYSPTIFTYQLNKWYTVRHEIKFTSGNDGYWRTFIAEKGQPLQKRYDSGPRKTSDGGGQYFKLGIYFWINVTALGYFTNIKIFKKN